MVMDLTGPMSAETWSGMLHALVVGECGCRFGTGKLLSKKDETYDALFNIINQPERQPGVRHRIIRKPRRGQFSICSIGTFVREIGVDNIYEFQRIG